MNIEHIKTQLLQANTLAELQAIYHEYPEWREGLTPDYMQKKYSLEENQKSRHYQPNFIHDGNNAINARTANQKKY